MGGFGLISGLKVKAAIMYKVVCVRVIDIYTICSSVHCDSESSLSPFATSVCCCGLDKNYKEEAN